MSPRVVTVLVLIAALAGAAPVRADEPAAPPADDRALQEAATRYDRGVELARRGDDAAALAEFEAAYALSRRWEVLLNIGVTEKRLFRYGRAIRTLERYLAEGGDAVPAAKRRDVEAELTQLRELVGSLVVIVEGAPARITVDGLDEGETPLPGPLLLAPGAHTVRAERAGEVADEQVVELVSGRTGEVTLRPRAAPPPVTTAQITLRSRPDGATLVLDDQPLGRAPWTGELVEGGHTVVVELPGHVRQARELTVVAGEERTVTIELSRVPPPPPPLYRRPWVWGAAAAVVVGAAVTGYVIATQPEEPDVPVHWPPQ